MGQFKRGKSTLINALVGAPALATFVSEEHNPGNEKDVTGVEVFVPSPLLACGLCLVDTIAAQGQTGAGGRRWSACSLSPVTAEPTSCGARSVKMPSFFGYLAYIAPSCGRSAGS